MTYKEVLQFSEDITRKFGSNYFRATTLFPKSIREAVFLYYAWTRIPDEYVDSEKNKEKSRQLLTQWIDDWSQAKIGKRKEKDIHYYMCKIFEEYRVSSSYGDDFLFAMKQDLEKNRYKDYQELERYMYGSAVVVGLTMLCFFKINTKDILNNARSFAEAMQLSNFLRDVREDFDHMGRVYIPQEDMDRFGVSIENIAHHLHTESFKKLMAFEIARCRTLYREGWIGINQLPWRIKFPIRIAARKYEGILDEIEKSEYDIWSKKHVLPKYKKLLIIIKSLFV